MPSIIGEAMGTTAAPDYRAKASQKYQDMFGRAGDEEGINYWSNYLSGGKTDDQFNTDFANASKNVYGDYLSNANSKYATDPNLSKVLSGDLKTGTNAGNVTGANQQGILQQGLNPDIYNRLYGTTTGTTQTTPQTLSSSPAYATPAATYTPAQLGTPTSWNVTPEQTVEGRINSLTDPNSPIIQMARTRALEQQNANGTLNSSLAITAGQKAAYDAAIPIASADASTFAKAAGYNADEKNQFAVQNAGFTNQAGQFNSNAANTLTGQKLATDTSLQQSKMTTDTQKTLADLDAKTKSNLANLDATTKTNLAQLDSTTRNQLAQIDASARQLLQANQSATNLFSQITQNITNISASKDMDAAAKQAAVDNQLSLLKTALGVTGTISNLNLAGLLDFSKAAA